MPRVPRTPAAMFPVAPGPVRRHWPAPFASYRDSLSLSPVALIPAYNEAAVIESVVAATLEQISNVIVVDDGSTDATADLAGAAGAEVIRLPRNRGKAGAVMAGFAAALARGYTAVVMLDADGQHLPGEIPTVLAPVLSGDADLVVGSRFLDVRSEIPRYRVLGQKTLNLFTALGAGVSLTDTQSGFRAFGPAALARLDFVSDGYSLESDMIAHFASCGLRIVEVPISCRYDVPNSHKKNPVLHGFEIVRAMSYAIAVRQRRVLGFIGLPFVMFGSVIGVTPAFLPPSAFQLSSPAVVVGLLAVGSVLILGSLWPLVKTRSASSRTGSLSPGRRLRKTGHPPGPDTRE